MRKYFLILWVGSMIFLFAACSNGGGESSDMIQVESNMAEPQFTMEDRAFELSEGEDNSGEIQGEEAESAEKESGELPEQNQNRVIIYHADLFIEVKNYEEAVEEIQTQVKQKGGYIVDSSMHGREENNKTGYLTLRIPQEHFQSFLQFMEEGSFKVLESSTSGEDVTEEYVDLESRLKSKRVVEERLLGFMEEAEKTEDLLKISSDLAKVQEEIDQIVGRMKYLENKSELATVTIHIEENTVTLTGEDDLNTWDRTVDQFMKSINFLMSFFSSLTVFLIGGFPIIALVTLFGLAVIYIIRRRVRK